jgi:hypothetical protein
MKARKQGSKEARKQGSKKARKQGSKEARKYIKLVALQRRWKFLFFRFIAHAGK